MKPEYLARYEDALAAFRNGDFAASWEAVQLLCNEVPDWPKPQLLSAYIQRGQGRYKSEIHTLHGLIQRLDTAVPEWRGMAADAWSLMGSAYAMLGESRQAVRALEQSAILEPSWQQRQTEQSNAIFTANYCEDFSSAEFSRLYAAYQSLFAEVPAYEKRLYGHQKLRIGYMAAGACEHPDAYFLWPLLHGHHRENFVVYCYAAPLAEDAVTRQLQAEADVWRDIRGLSQQEAACQIRGDEIDILMELDGHTRDTCLPILAWRPATVQVSGIGYMNSTGLTRTDYFLSDRLCAADPAGQNFFTEKLLALPHSHFCYHPLRPMPPCGEAPCRQRGYITFGCFNNFSKVTDRMLTIWAQILAGVPAARLLLKHRAFDSIEGRQVTEKRLLRAGIALERVELRGFSAGYLEEYRDMDIALDTYPYTGGLTTCEALYMGVPVISLYGTRHGTRFGLSLLTNAGLGELAAASWKDYIDRAVGLAADTELLSLLHRELRNMLRSSHLMNERQYVQEIEMAWEQIYCQAAERGIKK